MQIEFVSVLLSINRRRISIFVHFIDPFYNYVQYMNFDGNRVLISFLSSIGGMNRLFICTAHILGTFI